MKTMRVSVANDLGLLNTQKKNYAFAYETEKATLHTSRVFITWRVYLKASRRSTMWFVDVHSYKLPSPSGVLMEHLWHRGST